MAEEEKEYQTYEEKLGGALAEENERLFREKARARRLLLSEQEQSLAQALIRLSGSEDFKTYVHFESLETSDRVIGAFATGSEMEGCTFGEKMAFNKGRSHQMSILRNKRDSIVKAYLNMLQQEKSKEDPNGT